MSSNSCGANYNPSRGIRQYPRALELRYTVWPTMNQTRALFLLLLLCPISIAQKQTSQPAQGSFFALPQMTPAQQENFPPQLLAELDKIKSAALTDDYAYRQVAHLTENIGARPSGSPQAQAAVDYVAAEMRQLGLDVQLEEVKVPHWVRGAETAELVEYPGQVAGTTQKIVLTALGGSTSTPTEGLAVTSWSSTTSTS